ncbi:MAG TPA: MarR family transcriptional regulator [Microthrixaceae bacterium]|nr:MarR family transcriptional regulator [Microthrixaceae bacterium]
MDTLLSTGALADQLGVSVPTVRRTASVLGLPDRRTGGGHRRFSPTDSKLLAERLGTTPTVVGFSSTEVKVLAAVARHPIGLRSMRAIGRAAHVSPTTAESAVRSLVARGLVRSTTETVAEGSARDLVVYRLKLGPGWSKVASLISQAVPPLTMQPTDNASASRVPQRFWHHFWNVDPGQLRLPDDGDFVARRLLLSSDPTAWAWAAQHLAPRSIQAARHARGVDGPTGAMIDNLLDGAT